MAFYSKPIPEFIQGSAQERLFLELLKQRENLVPFIGAGLSVPLCPSWGGFIDQYYAQVKGEYLDKGQRQEFAGLKKAKDYEAMLDLLFSATAGLKREELLTAAFKLKPDAAMGRKLALLHQAFPNLMITTNIDNLVFQTEPGGIHIYHGKKSEDLKRALIRGQRALLAIHGDLDNLDSLVFSKKEYDLIYGAENSFDPNAALPKFLAKVFDHHRLLFLGCSLNRDRVLDVLAARPEKRIHYALLHEKLKTKTFLSRLSQLYIKPIWISDFAQVETILACLAGPVAGRASMIVADRASINAPSVFVGRDKELARLKKHLTQGGTNIITGRLFTLEGAGGIGKTTLAREAAAQLSDCFPDGTLEFAIERFNPMTFAVELGKRLGLAMTEPATPELARSLISQLLKNRKILLLLDNLVKAADLPFMIPTDNETALMVTTRDRDCFQYLKLHRYDLKGKLEQLKLERFTPKEALALCKRTLGKSFLKAEKELYLEIAERLGFLPVALRPAYHLMAFKPRYSATELPARLNGPEILTVLAEARDRHLGLVQTVYALDSEWLDQEEHRVLLAHMAWFAPGPIPIDFLARFYDKPDLRNTLEEQQTRCWCTRQEGPEGPTCELHILVRETVKSQTSENLDDKLITLIDKAYREEHFEIKDRWLPQFQETLVICRKNRDRRQVDWIYDWFRSYFEQRGHNSLFINLADQVMDLFPEDLILAIGSAHKSAFLQRWGRLQEAYDLNQIAMEKLALLDDKEGLAIVYGNQALILNDWGRLEEAVALHQKVQALEEDLGNRAGLAICLWNQGSLFAEMGDPGKKAEYWRRAIQINRDIGITVEEDEKMLVEWEASQP